MAYWPVYQAPNSLPRAPVHPKHSTRHDGIFTETLVEMLAFWCILNVPFDRLVFGPELRLRRSCHHRRPRGNHHLLLRRDLHLLCPRNSDAKNQIQRSCWNKSEAFLCIHADISQHDEERRNAACICCWTCGTTCICCCMFWSCCTLLTFWDCCSWACCTFWACCMFWATGPCCPGSKKPPLAPPDGPLSGPMRGDERGGSFVASSSMAIGDRNVYVTNWSRTCSKKWNIRLSQSWVI